MKVSRIQVILFGFSILFLSSCSQKQFEEKEEMMTFLTNPENKYIQQTSVNGVNYSIMYRPTDMLVSQEVMESTSKSQIDSLRKKYKQYMYFNILISKNSSEILSNVASSGGDFGSMVNQLSFGMGDKVHLFSKTRDTIEMADYVYPRLYGMTDNTSMLFVYPRDKKVLDHEFFHFTIEDIGFNTGEVNLKIPTRPIIEEPSLNF